MDHQPLAVKQKALDLRSLLVTRVPCFLSSFVPTKFRVGLVLPASGYTRPQEISSETTADRTKMKYIDITNRRSTLKKKRKNEQTA